MSKPPAPRPHDPAYNRDDSQKPGRPPRPAQEPPGSESSSRSAKTLTDPATGKPSRKAAAPNASVADQNEASQD